MKTKNKLKLQEFLSKPRWQLRLIATLLLVIAAFRNDLVFAFISGLMLGWSFSFGDKK